MQIIVNSDYLSALLRLLDGCVGGISLIPALAVPRAGLGGSAAFAAASLRLFRNL